MEEEATTDEEQEMMTAMGFSGFGVKPHKKRRVDGNQSLAVADALSQPQPTSIAATGSNTVAVADQKSSECRHSTRALDGSLVDEAFGRSHNLSFRDAESTNSGQVNDGNQTRRLDSLRYGVTNEQGDIAYFKPSFVEDPWEGLKPQ